MNYEVLEHVGDAKIRAFGKTKEELFLHAMLGMNALLKPRITNRESRIKRAIHITSTDTNALLVDFLSEVNYLREVHGEVYDKARFTRFSDTPSANSEQVGLEGELEGVRVEGFGEDIKAVTFHDLDIHKNRKGLWETVVVFDI